MKRPNDGNTIGFAAALGAVATVAVTFAGIELANPHADIWANSWSYVALSLGGIGLIIAAVVWGFSFFDRSKRSDSLKYVSNARIKGLATPDSEVEHLPEDKMTEQVPIDSYAKSQTKTHIGVAAVTRHAEEAATAADDASHTSPPSDRVQGRAGLAARLEIIAESLEAISRRLKRTSPDPGQSVVSFWRMGLDEVGHYIDRVDRLQIDCQAVISEEPESYHNDTVQMTALKQLEQAVTDAFGVRLAAIDSLEHPDQPLMPGSRNDYYIRAADSLDELGKRCMGLAMLMRGAEELRPLN
jgi:hypothetical protein